MGKTGLLAIPHGEELSPAVESATDLQRVDAAVFGMAAPFTADSQLTAYRFLRQGFALSVRADAILLEIEAAARNGFRIGFEEILPRIDSPDVPAVETTIVHGSRARLSGEARREP